MAKLDLILKHVEKLFKVDMTNHWIFLESKIMYLKMMNNLVEMLQEILELMSLELEK